MDSNNLQLHIHRFKTPLVKLHKNFKRIQQIIVKLRHSQSKLLNSTSLSLDVINRLITSQDQLNKKLKSRLAIHDDLTSRLQTRILFTPSSHDYATIDKNLLIVDYLLRAGGTPEISQLITEHLHLTDLIDVDVISQGISIYNQIKDNNNLNLLISWCIENEKFMPPPINPPQQSSNEEDHFIGKYGLMFECQIQHCIELIKSNDLQLALDIIKVQYDNYPKLPSILKKISSLPWIMQFNQLDQVNNNDPFDVYTDKSIEFDQNLLDLLNPTDKWTKLADLFWFNFKSIYGLPINPPLLTMLSIGGSTMKCLKCATTTTTKTPETPSYLSIFYDLKCPICSNSSWQEMFNEIPSSYHSKSSIFPNPVLLPNKNILPLDTLLANSSNLNDLNNLNICSSGIACDEVDEDDSDSNADNFIYNSNRGFLNPKLLGMSIDQAKDLIPSWSIEDPVSFNRFKIRELEKVFIT